MYSGKVYFYSVRVSVFYSLFVRAQFRESDISARYPAALSWFADAVLQSRGLHCCV